MIIPLDLPMAILHALAACSVCHLAPTDPPARSTPPSATEDRVIVRCKSEAMIRGADVLMRDIAEIEAPSAELQARIGDIHVASRPALGYNRVFPSADILRRLVAAGLGVDQVDMQGASEVVAQPLATLLNPKDIRDVADPVLRAILDAQQLADTEVEFELQNDLKTLHVPPGRYDLALRATLRDGQLRPSSATIDLEILVDQEVYRSLPLNYRLRHYVPVLTTTRVIKRGEAYDQSNLAMQRTEVAAGANMQITSFDLVAGMVAARDVQNNQALKLADIERPALVHRNDLVTLIAKRGSIEVSTKAVALGSAPQGGRVLVRSLSSSKPVQAIVYAAGIVVIPN